MKNIEAGYLVKITTWENDADNYNTTEFSGLTKDQAQLIIDIASLFSSNGRGIGYGNCEIEEENEALYTEIDKIISTFTDGGGILPDAWAEADSEWIEKYYSNRYDDPVYDLIGIWNEGEYYRVFELFEVFFVPQAIENVSDQFTSNGK